MKLLVLGGTAFLGRAVAAEAVSWGMQVTCLARGSGPVAEGARLVRADRDAEDGLVPVANRRWDAVVDVTRQPGQARRAVRDLAADHWVFVSSGNVYAHFDTPDRDESAPLLEPLAADVMPDLESYGPAKVACENAVRDVCPSHTVIRAGLIGGAGDESGRSGYYPWRFAHPTGDDVLVPPDLTFPIALIDVDDLARWIVGCAVQRVRGVFNASGPVITLGELLHTARAVARSTARIRPVTREAMTQAGVGPWMGPATLPLWIDDPEWRHFADMDATAARAVGLRTRPLVETLDAAMTFEDHRDGPRRAGLTDEEERDLRRMARHV